MPWIQVTDPFNNLALSATVALAPILFIFWALLIRKMKGYQASLIATGLAMLIVVFVYRMPFDLALMATLHGAIYGVFPICWIVITAVFLFNITVRSGHFEAIKHSLASITSDRRLQALLIAFSFGSFLEGTAGFGAPVAITAAMLVGLGFQPLYAAGICLIANTAPVAFGSVGIPITVAAQVSGIPEMAISQMVGRTLPFLSVFLPFYLVVIVAGFRKASGVLPAVIVSGVSFALLQWSSSNFLGPALPDVIAGIGSIGCLLLLLKFWQPKETWRFNDEPLAATIAPIAYTRGQVFNAWVPFLFATVMIITWGLTPVKQVLNDIGLVQFEVPLIHEATADRNGSLIPHVFRFNYLSASGTAILLASIFSVPLLGLGARDGVHIFLVTLKQLRFPVLTVAAVLGFAYLVNASGISITIALLLANTGILFPFFAPVLGWLGVFITGSDTSANALFGKLQFETARSIGVDPVVTVSANVSGGVVGKMISPQSIAVAAAAGNLVGKESELFRFAAKHSFIMLALICAIVLAQAYVAKFLIPVYTMNNVAALSTSSTARGYLYLLGVAVIIVTIAITVLTIRKRKVQR
jgi:lactate permease